MTRGPAPAVTQHGSGPTAVVLVHGTCGSGSDWGGVVPFLAERCRVAVVDRRAGTDASYSLDVEARDLAGVVASLDRPVHLVGHSYGAICVLAAAALVPVASVVLYEPPAAPARVPAAAIGEVTRRLADGDRDGAARAFLADVARVPAAELEVLRAIGPVWDVITANVHTVPAEAAQVLAWQQPPPLAVPALFLRGELTDAPIYVEGEANVRRALPGARVAVVAGQRHLAVGFDPAQVAALVLDHLPA